MKYLLAQGAPRDDKDVSGLSAPLYAALRGHIHLLKFFISEGLDIENLRAQDGCNALLLAIEGGHLDAVKFLIAKGASTDVIYEDGPYSCLEKAVEQGHEDLIQFFLDKTTKLCLVNKELYQKRLKLLCRMLKRNTTISYLNLSNTLMTDQGAEMVADMLKENHHIGWLLLSSNHMISDKVKRKLLAAVQDHNRALCHLTIDDDSAQACAALTDRNRQWRKSVERGAVSMLVGARVLLRASSVAAGGGEEDGWLGSMPPELVHMVLMALGGSQLTDEEKKLILEYASRKETLGRDQYAFLRSCMRAITCWPTPAEVEQVEKAIEEAGQLVQQMQWNAEQMGVEEGEELLLENEDHSDGDDDDGEPWMDEGQ